MESRVDLSHLIRRAQRQFPSSAPIEDDVRAVTLAGAVDRAERLANALEGLGPPGAPVAILSENRVEYVETDLALALGRKVRVALNERLAEEDFAYAIEDCGAGVLVHSARHAETAALLAARTGVRALGIDDPAGYEALIAAAPATPTVRPGGEEETAWISYTSGTTGRPKGVVLSRRAIRHVTVNLLLGLGPVRPGEQIVLAQPLSHGAGYFVLPWLLCGAGLIIQRRFDPEAMAAAAARERVGALKVVPAMLPPLLELRSPPRPRRVIYGGAPIGRPLLEASLERLGPVLVQIYGQSEAPMTLTYLDEASHLGEDDRRLSVGRPWRSVALEARGAEGERLGAGEIGEIHVSGDHMMSGYLGMPETTGEVLGGDGWLATRDMGHVDERGYVHLLGRLDEMIISGGFNVAPREVELCLLEHPGVEECVVFGAPDERWGQAIWAAVVSADPGLAEADVIGFSRPRLGFRAPRRVVFVPDIPKNAYGKLDRTRLMAAVGEA
ncbi:MAG TPA: AMP-binding protein [Solirubrobacterales bacterium]|jgi:fatty-acyl-CoA synthase|nr:AMP-binding protein [Solirubrobacterales bacterium]